jgi:Predicted membrane protein, hemolysin III homolog
VNARAQIAGRTQTLGEEIASSVTHGVGLLGSIVLFPFLIVAASRDGDRWRVTSAIVFGISLILLYAASTFYHALPGPRAKRVFRVIDHSAIYVLIAGTYTPSCSARCVAGGGGRCSR